MKEVALYHSGVFNLIPSERDGDQQPVRYIEGEYYTMDIKHVRNIAHHRKFFALMNLAHTNSPMDLPFDPFRDYLLIKSGYGEAYQTPEGVILKAKSISFEKMDQIEFNELYGRVLDKVVEHLGTTSDEINKQLIGFF